MQTVTLDDAKTQLLNLFEVAFAGEEVTSQKMRSWPCVLFPGKSQDVIADQAAQKG